MHTVVDALVGAAGGAGGSLRLVGTFDQVLRVRVEPVGSETWLVLQGRGTLTCVPFRSAPPGPIHIRVADDGQLTHAATDALLRELSADVDLVVHLVSGLVCATTEVTLTVDGRTYRTAPTSAHMLG